MAQTAVPDSQSKSARPLLLVEKTKGRADISKNQELAAFRRCFAEIAFKST